MSTWKYVQGGQERGPVETNELQALLDEGTVNAETLIWKESFTDWVPIRTIPEFKLPPAQAQAPPPFASSSAAPPPQAGAPPLASADADQADIDQNKVYAILAYIGLLFLVPLLVAPNSKFARYHTNQGIVLFLATVITSVASMVMAMIPLIGCVAWLLPILIAGGALVLMILGIINAANGEFKPLPMIGHFEILK
jgi:uncharacterized membrane protein